MGRKQNRGRNHFLFLVAGLIVILLTGCASFEKFLEDLSGEKTMPEDRTPSAEATGGVETVKRSDLSRLYLSEARKLFRRGNYEGAFREYQKASVLLKKNPPADEALFFMGLIQGVPENPGKDPRRSIEFMQSLVTDFPQSAFAEPAKAWIGVLKDNERLVKANEKSLQEKEILSKDYEKLHKANEKLVKDHEKLIKDNEKLNKDNEKLNKMLEEYKQVDIEIEGKKREKGR